MSLRLLEHPLALHLLTRLRDRTTEPQEFRRHSRALCSLLILEATRDLPLLDDVIETPLETMRGRRLGGSLAVVPILRAGLSMLEPALELFPDVAVGCIGLERSHSTAIANSYYSKLPPLDGRIVLCLDPMLATGGSASQAISLIKAAGAESVVMVCVVAAPEGVFKLQSEHSDVPIVAAAVDRELNELKYILPGLGDFGDRLFGT